MSELKLSIGAFKKTVELKVQLHFGQKLPRIPATAEQVQLGSGSPRKGGEAQQNVELESATRKDQTQLLRKTADQQLPTRIHPRVQRVEQRDRPIAPICPRRLID